MRGEADPTPPYTANTAGNSFSNRVRVGNWLPDKPAPPAEAEGAGRVEGMLRRVPL
jgi:hypothetical protein